VTTNSGVTLQADADNIPRSLFRPDWDAVVTKFQTLTPRLPTDRREYLVETVRTMESQTDLTLFHQALAGEVGTIDGVTM
jgi:hypothetical protein